MTERPKTLPPSLRPRWRYIAYQVMSEEKVKLEDLMNTIWHSILNFLGEAGASQSGIWIIKNTYDENRQMGLIRCKHTAVEQVRTALALVQRVGDTRIVIRVLGVSGTIKTAKKKFFGERDLKNFTR